MYLEDLYGREKYRGHRIWKTDLECCLRFARQPGRVGIQKRGFGIDFPQIHLGPLSLHILPLSISRVWQPTRANIFPPSLGIYDGVPPGFLRITARMCAWNPLGSIGFLSITSWNSPATLSSPALSIVKAIQGKKTDKRDAKWIAGLFKYDLVSGSFIPPADIRQLRDLARYRRKPSNFTIGEKNRTQNCLTISNFKLEWCIFRCVW